MARPVMELLDLLGRRWTLRVLWELREGRGMTFRDLRSRCDEVSSSVLADRVRELGDAGILGRDDDGYVLTARGQELLVLLLPLDEWARTRWRGAARRSRR